MDYRAYSIGPDGHIKGFEPIVCDDDEQAIAAAKRLVGAYDIELWQGTRIVTRLSKNSKD
jgi:hypothetical protein